MRFDFRGPLACWGFADAGGFGDGIAVADRRLPFRAGVRSALAGGWPNDVAKELERGGTGEGLIVDENGTYIADGGSPVGVDVRSERSEPEPPDPDEYDEYSSERGEAGVTVAEIHAL